ncbi:hypothetical protein [Rhabdaerophilum sp. SD176]|uniref:hypothetical protein n=1 Tax=Rhabdaerophilum sp. SD176 TaxID=2983548 RepID=UPI0024DF84EF|nr:hypothetical protein [Rhabdaerophilum sp. SD176]
MFGIPRLAVALAGSFLLTLALPVSLHSYVPDPRSVRGQRGAPEGEPQPPDPRFAGLSRALGLAFLSRGFGRAGDLWFRPEPARTRLALALGSDSRYVAAATELRHSLSGALDRSGWFLAFGSLVRLSGGNAGAEPRLLQQRMVVGRTWRHADLQLTVQAGLSRIGLDSLATTLTGRAERLGLVAAMQLWHDWPEGGPAGLRFIQLALEADRAREGVTAIARISFSLGASSLALGPECLASAGERWRLGPLTYRDPYRHLRLGAHASGLRLGRASLTLSAGALFDSREKPRPYAAFGLVFAY